MEIEDKIRQMLETTITNQGYILDEVIYEKEDGNNFLRLIIDKKDIITVDDCVIISNLVNPILDSEDPISDRYILDVCSKEKGRD
mgnify:CR=1 FL=1